VKVVVDARLYRLVVDGRDVLPMVPRRGAHGQYTVLDRARAQMVEHDVVRYGEDGVVVAEALRR